MVMGAVAFIFRLINLALFVALVSYIFKKYLYPSLEDAVSEQEAYKTGLQQQQGMFEYRLHESAMELEATEREYLALKNKIDAWQVIVANQEKQAALEKEHISQRMIKRVREQQEQFIRETLLRQAMAHAIGQATEKLKNYYQDGDKAEHYMQSIIVHDFQRSNKQ